MENKEPETTIFCNQAILPVVGVGYQPSQETHLSVALYILGGLAKSEHC